MTKRKKVGLALGSGAARGFASIGVLKALREIGVEPDFIGGTSMGALVGAFAAVDAIETLEEVAEQTDWKHLFGFFSDVVIPRDGLIDGKRIESFIRKYTGERNIEDLKVPLKVVATDILTGEEVLIDSGNILEAIRASISIPGIFAPVRIGDRYLVDGALVNPVPVNVVKNMGAQVVIAVDVNHFLFEGEIKEPAGDRKEEKRGRKKGRHLRISRSRAVDMDRITASLLRRFKGVDMTILESVRKWKERFKGPNIVEIMLNSAHIKGYYISKYMLELNPPDVVIAPPVGKIKLLEFHRASEAIEAGYISAKEKEKEIIAATGVRKTRRNKIKE
jgi:NTE family protein